MATVTRRVLFEEVPVAWRDGLDDVQVVEITLTTDLEPLAHTPQPRPPGDVLREIHARLQAAGGGNDLPLPTRLPLPPREPVGQPMTFDE
ncbi:MAG: hypothetical protein GKR94_23520 [Gammaproteobacteria bacterium]|nr:hypothetical protein [Gammaproteobacteria bacterium]